jgi:hypothetical protein
VHEIGELAKQFFSIKSSILLIDGVVYETFGTGSYGGKDVFFNREGRP